MGKPPCGAEPRIELGPALQQADALPTEQRRTMVRRCSVEKIANPQAMSIEYFVFSSFSLKFSRYIV